VIRKARRLFDFHMAWCAPLYCETAWR
jgi:hypothetical protein